MTSDTGSRFWLQFVDGRSPQISLHTMAEVAAAISTADTAVKEEAVGACTTSKSTARPHVRFHKIASPDTSLGRSSHSLTIVKSNAYIFGGDVADGEPDNKVHIVTLPTDLALDDVDYQAIDPTGQPLAPDSDRADGDGFQPAMTANEAPVIPKARAAHAATSIDSNIYIFGGRPSIRGTGQSPAPFNDNGTVYAFSTITHKWTSLPPQTAACSAGVPCPRAYASCASSRHPLPVGGQDVTTEEAYGTIFLHGGYDVEGKLLRDVWTFDVSSREWNRWPDIPPPGPDEAAGEGRICCIESRLWRTGDGFGKVTYLEIVRDDADDASGKSELGVSPKTGEWNVLSFHQNPATPDQAGAADETVAKGPTTRAEDELPIPRQGAGFVPITTGAGREYLLYFMGEETHGRTLSDVWTLQINSDKNSPAMHKDVFRHSLGSKTGENQWAKCEVVQSTQDNSPLLTPQGLSRFAADAWSDRGGGVAVLWGGKTVANEVVNEGWVITVE